jgi:trimeric autotransporter adhesin
MAANRARAFLWVLFCTAWTCSGQGIINTIAGNGSATASGDGGSAISAGINPFGLAADGAGNVYVSDYTNHAIRKVTPAGIISAFAGCAGFPPPIACILAGVGDGGPATSAVAFVFNVAVDAAGNVYFSDSGNLRIRKIDTAGILSTVAGGGAGATLGDGGPATSVALKAPDGVAVDSTGNVYFADVTDHRVRKVTPAGIITTVAGNGTAGFAGDGGPGSNSQLNTPHGLAVDNAGNLYIADTLNYRIRKVTPAGIITTVAGNGQVVLQMDGGQATASSMAPWYVALDAAGNLYFAEPGDQCVRMVSTSGVVSTVAGMIDMFGFSGDGGPGNKALLNANQTIALDASGNLYVADAGNYRVRKVGASSTSAPPAISTIVNGASFLPGVVPNSWVTISGTNLASVSDTWASSIMSGNLPTTLDGVKVTIGSAPAYVYYVSPTQINVLVSPLTSPGLAQVTVTTPAGTSAAVSSTAAQYGPAFFGWPNNQPVATHQNFTLAAKNGTFASTTTVPATQGEVIILWGTGFGPTIPAVPPGILVPSSVTYSTSQLPTVTVGNMPATVYGAALASGYAGLYQVAIQVPGALANGDWPVVITIGGVSSPTGMVLTVSN